MQKYTEGQKEMHCAFVDVEKTYDRALTGVSVICSESSGRRRRDWRGGVMLWREEE